MTIRLYASIIINLLYFSISLPVFGQQIIMTGNVFDPVCERNVSNISIFTTDTIIGTISNLQGDFSINMPVEYEGKYLYFTGIGYKKDSIRIVNGDFRVKLSPEVYELKEIYVMPDSTLLSLLRKAYNRIKENYPVKPTFSRGFYRESIQDGDKCQVDFVEALLGVYKEPYNRTSKEPGQLEIIKSRKKNLKDIGLIYYGGHFLAIDGDAVLTQADYINPKYFKDYTYQFEGIRTLNGNDFYAISFLKNREKSMKLYSGTMLIDKESLAYASFEINSNHNANPFRVKESEKNIKIFYELITGKWHLKNYTYTNQHIDKLNEKKRYVVIEYMTISISEDSINPIPYDRRLNFMEAIALKAEEYTKNGWTDYDDLNDNHFGSYDFQFSINQSADIFQNQHPTAGIKIKKGLFSVISKINMGVGLSYRPVVVSTMHPQIRFDPGGNHSLFYIEKEWDRLQETVLLQFSAGYRIGKNLNMFYQENIDIFEKQVFSNEKAMGVDWRKNISNGGLPLFLKASCVFHSRTYCADLGKYENIETFHYKNRKFDAKMIAFDYGIRQYTISPRLALSKKITRLLEMEAYFVYHFPFSEKKIFRIKEKEGFSLFRKKATIYADNNDLQIRNNFYLWDSIGIARLQVGISFIFN
jgi:hypothetical protein